MKTKGFLKAIVRNYENGRWVAQFELSEPPQYPQDKELSVEVKEYRKHRSLTANAYYWTLLTELAKKIGRGNSYMHNKMLCEYSSPVILEDVPMTAFIPDTYEALEKIFNAETYHLKPTTKVIAGKNGDLRCCYVMKGSHDMNTEEFSRLLNGLIDECQQCGIETLTPDELARLRYEERHAF